MGDIEKKLRSLGLVLPPPVKPPAGVVLPFQFVRLVGDRGYISGHGPQNLDGSIAAPLNFSFNRTKWNGLFRGRSLATATPCRPGS